MAFQIKPTVDAARQIRNESHWWRRNRTKAPNLFRDELRRAFALIAEYPEAGAITEDLELRGVRRVVLVDTQHYVYYRVNDAAKRIEVLAVWSTKLGAPPPLHTA
ncbi:MAG: type II toxin-antitoxin system RelE/ParE family toxin [Acidobacteria bacterium]|nr:type II toxin-antitoxin system RelE/ParE family toxin [Acidobacteriota bacterium]